MTKRGESFVTRKEGEENEQGDKKVPYYPFFSKLSRRYSYIKYHSDIYKFPERKRPDRVKLEKTHCTAGIKSKAFEKQNNFL